MEFGIYAVFEFASRITSYDTVRVTRPTDTIFQEPWWLDAVAPGQWSAHEFHEGGELKAWMPLVDKPRALGIKHFGMPHLTQTLGPWIQPVEGAEFRRIGRIHDYTTALITSLQPVAVTKMSATSSTRSRVLTS